MNLEERNREIDLSMNIGAKAFGAGAVLILALVLTGAPNARNDDMIAGSGLSAASAGDSYATVSTTELAAGTGVALDSRPVDASELSP